MKKFFKGFTLAEVLITLTVIGVVAALTLPTVISHHNKKVVETRLAKFYSVMNQAFQMAVAENGDPDGWVECDEYNNCYTNYSSHIAQYLKNVEYEEVDQYGGVYTFRDGTAAISSFNTFCLNKDICKLYVKLTDCIERDSVGEDISSDPSCDLAYNENKYNGRKSFFFSFSPKGWLPNKNDTACNGESCVKLIMQNGWKIPKDYPYKL